ncbi:hypothetical protein ACLOJK_018602, partial [Asimina triloba]
VEGHNQFEWNGVGKSVSTTLVGVSPEFEIALYTPLFLFSNSAAVEEEFLFHEASIESILFQIPKTEENKREAKNRILSFNRTKMANSEFLKKEEEDVLLALPIFGAEKGEGVNSGALEKKIDFLESLASKAIQKPLFKVSNRRSRRWLNDRLLIELVPRLNAEEIRGLFAPPPWGDNVPLSPFCMTNVREWDAYRSIDMDKESSMIEALSSTKRKERVHTDRMAAVNAWKRIDCRTREALRRNFLPDLVEGFEVCCNKKDKCDVNYPPDGVGKGSSGLPAAQSILVWHGSQYTCLEMKSGSCVFSLNSGGERVRHDLVHFPVLLMWALVYGGIGHVLPEDLRTYPEAGFCAKQPKKNSLTAPSCGMPLKSARPGRILSIFHCFSLLKEYVDTPSLTIREISPAQFYDLVSVTVTGPEESKPVKMTRIRKKKGDCREVPNMTLMHFLKSAKEGAVNIHIPLHRVEEILIILGSYLLRVPQGLLVADSPYEDFVGQVIIHILDVKGDIDEFGYITPEELVIPLDNVKKVGPEIAPGYPSFEVEGVALTSYDLHRSLSLFLTPAGCSKPSSHFDSILIFSANQSLMMEANFLRWRCGPSSLLPRHHRPLKTKWVPLLPPFPLSSSAPISFLTRKKRGCRPSSAFDEAAFEAERLSLDAQARQIMAEEMAGSSSSAGGGNDDDPKAWKWAIRKTVWDMMEATNIAQNPRPIHHRIPNFVGAAAAAKKLGELDAFRTANCVKVNPDSPQKQVRFLTLSGGKKLLTPQPRLRTGFFSVLESQMLQPDAINEACTSAGVAKHGRPIGLDEKIKVDLIIIGSVAVDSKTGARLGKGEGFAELEYGMLRYMGAVDDTTLIVTSVHDRQLVDGIPVEKLLVHDVPVDIICTPTQVIFTNTSIPKPQGIYWEKLSPEKLGQIRILRELKHRIEKETGQGLPYGPSEKLPPLAQRKR